MNSTKIKRYQELLGVKMRLDKFFSMYLDKYGDQMDADKVDTPIWKLYKSKLNEYDEVSKELKVLDYWLTKTEEKLIKSDVESLKSLLEEAAVVEQQKVDKQSPIIATELAPDIDDNAVSLAEEGLETQKSKGATLHHIDEDEKGFVVAYKDGSRKGFRYDTGEEVVSELKPVDEIDN
jgi:hypothetical protein